MLAGLAAQAEEPAESGEAADAGEAFREAADRAVEWVALDDPRDPDDEPDSDRNSPRKAPRVVAVAPQAEVVEDVARLARDPRPEQHGAGRRHSCEHEQHRGGRGGDER